ncbi:glycosyltransferase family 4 protein [Virgibacillus flavescens]|uniref:glycosyltransferase family 4 protein n=1 Tax=Virgibacillus flavescens TaxID=1611422 RepID=UPI003D334E24
MKILHICSGYPDTGLYQNLLGELDANGIQQIMYVPYKTSEIKNKRMLEHAAHVSYVFSSPHNKFDRLVYFSKVRKITKDIIDSIDLSDIDLTHAHFLFSNGGAAYRLKKKMGIDYIVAVRNTDINVFFKYGIHLRKHGVAILKEAKKIIFLSPAYKDYLIEHYIPSHLKDRIRDKSYVVPNGIDNFWLENSYDTKELAAFSKTIRLVFVGELNQNKNVMTALGSVLRLKEKGFDVRFDIIGTGPLENEIKTYIKTKHIRSNVTLHGYVNDKNRLLAMYREADIFLMPSFHETFGLVYIEAMTQGLPVIYSRGQGIDGYFEEGEVGYAVNPASSEDISRKIETIMDNYEAMNQQVINVVGEFKWSKIASVYQELYESKQEV